MQLPPTTALVVVDVQDAIDHSKWGPRNNRHAECRIARLLEAWRKVEMAIVHVRHDSTEPDSPYRPGQPGNSFKREAAPLPGEIVVPKRTNSAFVGTDIRGHLNTIDADVLVMCGVLTNNSLEMTARHAGNLGYQVFVPEDACWAVDKTDLRGRHWAAEDVHHLALANLHGEYATVTTVDEILSWMPPRLR